MLAQLVAYVTAHPFQVASAVIAVASFIVGLLPHSKTADGIASVLQRLSVLVPKDSPGTLKLPLLLAEAPAILAAVSKAVQPVPNASER